MKISNFIDIDEEFIYLIYCAFLIDGFKLFKIAFNLGSSSDGTPYVFIYNLVNGNPVLDPILVVLLFVIYIFVFVYV